MKTEAVVYFDSLYVPDEIRTLMHISYWGDVIYKKQKLSDYVKGLFARDDSSEFFHIRTNEQLSELITHFSLTHYKSYFFINSSFAITDPDKFQVFLDKIKYVDESLAIYRHEVIKSFLRLKKDEIIAFLRLVKSDPEKLLSHLFLQFDGKVEPFRLETFYIDIHNYLDFISFLQSNFALRYFNSIEKKEDIIVKRSADRKKMKMEYSYYHLLPEKQRIYFLPTFDYQESDDFAQYSIERLNIPDLAVQWIHPSINDEQFEVLLQRLFGFLNIRQKRKIDKNLLTKAADALYIDKVNERLVQLKAAPLFNKLENIFSASTLHGTIDSFYGKYAALYKKISASKLFANEQVIGHGDFCFSNILYDKRINLIKLIDPKGSLEIEAAYMDAYYDVAKLSHSVLGNYDFINNGLFELYYDQRLQLRIEIKHVEGHTNKQQMFIRYLKENGFDYNLVRLCELSLFLSMVPLHIDNEKNVLAYLLNAATILEELEKSHT